jgi:hypothetical protein
MNILEKTMAEMKDSFTSKQFNKRAVLNGYPKEKIETNSGLGNFIKKYADNAYKGSKTWIKRKPNNFVTTRQEEGYHFRNFEEIIDFVKSKGYKILKPISDWVEC